MEENKKASVYIPADLDECFSELKKIMTPQQLEEFKNKKEEEVVGYHMGLGKWIRNNWGLWQGSRLAEYFNKMGIHHPDDMSGIILDTFWCHLNGKPLKVEERVKDYQEYWEYNTVPKDLVSPVDGAKIDFIMSLPCKDAGASKNCRIHLGRSRTDGSIWAYQYGKGVFEPTEEQKRAVLGNNKD